MPNISDEASVLFFISLFFLLSFLLLRTFLHTIWCEMTLWILLSALVKSYLSGTSLPHPFPNGIFVQLLLSLSLPDWHYLCFSCMPALFTQEEKSLFRAEENTLPAVISTVSSCSLDWDNPHLRLPGWHTTQQINCYDNYILFHTKFLL